MIKVYMASDIKHAKRWIEMRALVYPQVAIVSSWIDFLQNGEPNISEDLMRESWLNNIKDIDLSDVILYYYEKGDRQRGALFECGVGFAIGRRLAYVGPPEGIGPLRGLFSRTCTNMDEVLGELHVCSPTQEERDA